MGKRATPNRVVAPKNAIPAKQTAAVINKTFVIIGNYTNAKGYSLSIGIISYEGAVQSPS